MKKWKILNKLKVKNEKLKVDGLIKILLENRRIKTKKEVDEFLNPKLSNRTINNLEIDPKQLRKAVLRIKDAIKKEEKIVVFGDYDVDGICGTAILWETLNSLGAKIMPYIPHRIDEGYGLSQKGISNVKLQISNVKLIITVDNGIVANKAVDFANEKGIDVIITDHHVASKKLPNALAIVQTTKLCGAGVAWMFAQKFIKNEKHLELVALATVADLVPLKEANRTLLKLGLEQLRKTKRIGLVELLKEAGLAKELLGVYEIGHMIAPRLNAMGRLEYAMDSLRLICTNNQKRAEELARLLGTTNRERQDLTLQSVLHAKQAIRDKKQAIRKLVFISHKSYEPGIIGLVAGKLVEEFYRPAIVVSIGEKFSKASARSIRGFNIIEFIREHASLLVDAGGHPMAAGFTVETTKLIKLQKALENRAELVLNEDLLTRSLRIDCELSLDLIDSSLYKSLQELSPFGMGNPEPTFISKSVVEDVRIIGAEGNHLKLVVSGQKSDVKFSAIAFGMGEMFAKIKIGDKIDIVYTIDENEWNEEKRLQLKIKDISRDLK